MCPGSVKIGANMEQSRYLSSRKLDSLAFRHFEMVQGKRKYNTISKQRLFSFYKENINSGSTIL